MGGRALYERGSNREWGSNLIARVRYTQLAFLLYNEHSARDQLASAYLYSHVHMRASPEKCTKHVTIELIAGAPTIDNVHIYGRTIDTHAARHVEYMYLFPRACIHMCM